MTAEALIDNEASDSTVVLMPKTKPKKVSSTKNQDAIIDVSHELENLTKEKAEALAFELVDAEGSNEFRLGGVFSVIKSNGWFDGYKNFPECVSQKYGMEYRKAQYCINIYEKLIGAEISWDQVKELNSWTKVIILAPVLSLENVADWVAKAKDVNCETLKAMVKASQTTGGTITDDTPLTSEVKTLTFKAHPDQQAIIKDALQKAKDDSGTSVDTVALEYICMDYMGTPAVVHTQAAPAVTTPTEAFVATQPVSILDAIKAAGWKATLEAFEAAYPTINLKLDEDSTVFPEF